MMISEAMNRTVVTVLPDAPIEEAAALADRAGVDHLLVVDEQNLVGIVCTCDLRDAGAGEHVCDCMSVPVMTVRPDAPIEDALLTMDECSLGCVPVAVGGLILGTVSDAELQGCGLASPHRHCHCARHRREPS